MNLRPRTETDREQKESVTKTTRNREKIWVQHCYSENEEELEGDAVGENYESKKRDSEGGGKKPVANWRCHRNSGNGRWRCNRPTIPGHSLCEHHLSQARVKNWNYARIRNQRNGPKRNINNVKKVYTSMYLEAEEEEEEWDDVDDNGFEKRGVMKARSINSLLSQTVPKYTTIKGNALTV